MVDEVESYYNYIDGEWVESVSGEKFEDRNPADVDDVVGYFQSSTEEDVELAVKAANKSQKDWENTPAPRRGEILKETAKILEDRKDELIHTFTREEGKTLSEAEPEVQRAINIFYYYAEKTRDLGGEIKSSSSEDSMKYYFRKPIGVVGILTPWNYPIAIGAWKIAPALATGNTVIYKPSNLAPNIPRMLIKALEDAGIPDGVVNYVTGKGSVVGEALISNPNINAISFTGSYETGEKIYRKSSKDQKRVQLEMGGKNPAVVMPSTDQEKAAEIVSNGAFGVTGQACTATSRAIVHEEIYEEFLENITKKAENIEVGKGLNDPDMGPQISEEDLEKTLKYIEIGKEEGAKLETGGSKLDKGKYSKGHFVEPTVFSNVDPEMRIAQEEIFGPVLSIIPVSNYEEAIKVTNDIEYGLSATILTEDLSEAHRFIENVDAGVVKVNEKTTGLELHLPFGGLKNSSSETYREQGDAAIEFYTITKTAYLNY